MATIVEVKVPDIGDFKDVPVIEVLVKAGDVIKAEDALVTLESDKATMDVPSPAAGTVSELQVKVGDKVAESSLILTLATGVDGAAAPAPQAPGVAPPTAAPVAVAATSAASYAGGGHVACSMVVLGAGRLLDPYQMEVELTACTGRDKTGEKQTIRFQKAIMAAGSQAVKLPFMPEDPRVVDSAGALELKAIPKRMLVIGGGIIGLEMATGYSTLGTRIDVVEMLDGMMAGADRDLVKVWEKRNAPRFDNIMLKTKTVSAQATDAGIKVGFEGAKAPAEAQVYDAVLVAVGRSANGKVIDADKAGVAVTDRGFIPADKQMRTNVAHIFAIGDIVGQPMLAHKAVHEGHVAAEAAHGERAYFDARQIPSVAFTDPEVAWAGLTEEQCKAQGIKYGKAVFPWAASGRAIANGRDEGFTKLIFDEATHRVIGAGIVGTHAGDLIGELCLAVEMGCDPVDIGKSIHPHPTLCESVGMAAELFEGVCTDLPPGKKK